MYQIIDMDNEQVKACCQFEYKGFTISISTIFKCSAVGVFNDTNDQYVDTLQDAFNLIDDLAAKS